MNVLFRGVASFMKIGISSACASFLADTKFSDKEAFLSVVLIAATIGYRNKNNTNMGAKVITIFFRDGL